MDNFARRPRSERAEVFEETAARRGLGRAAIVEKDFWVCWVLHQLHPFFGKPAATPERSDPSVPSGLLFKGGTSLSKVYGAIERFSEDIDLTLDRETLGFADPFDPGVPGLSNKQREKLLKGLAEAAEEYVRDVMSPVLLDALRRVDDSASLLIQHDQNGVGVRSDERDQQTLYIAYPRALATEAYGAISYVQPVVKIEFGARGELWPAHRAHVAPFVAEEFAELFAVPKAMVNVLDLERTVWEKATILHQIASTGQAERRERMSRHYYDFAMLVQTREGDAALSDVALLERVAQYKSIFFKQPSARYDLARPGTLRLLPDANSLHALREDYARMREMFFLDPPSFDEIIATLTAVENRVNGGVRPS